MPPLTDRARVRALLETDRPWAVYALGDLAPPHADFAEWRATPDGAALVLVYRAFGQPVLYAQGALAGLAELLDELTAEPELYLLVRPEALPLLEARYAISHRQLMWRMLLDPARFPRADTDLAGAAALTANDCAALEALYADGAAAGEAPDFYSRVQVAEGVFCGIWEEGRLSAAAGTHLSAPDLNVAALGNVYVRRDRRGRGLGRAVTAAVTAALLERGLGTIALNVNQGNAAALSVYAGLGFTRYCAFWEGVARRRSTGASADIV